MMDFNRTVLTCYTILTSTKTPDLEFNMNISSTEQTKVINFSVFLHDLTSHAYLMETNAVRVFMVVKTFFGLRQGAPVSCDIRL